ncbi:MAG TPA: M20/M25/M40 family metallo-hydrolase [Steroidobacteraceae bacterium]|nr:M20/M25/M40 family metallo-hydrolase [Steroidobacteraceae bacterium]
MKASRTNEPWLRGTRTARAAATFGAALGTAVTPTALAALLAAVVACGPVAHATGVRAQVRAYRETHEKQILEEFSRLLAMPNVATQVADIEVNAEFISHELTRRGFATRLLAAAPGTPPAIYGELPARGARRTLIFYAHYDGQPVSQPEWRSSPWNATVREGKRATDSRDVDWRSAARIDPEWRIYARASSDDKLPIQAMLTALDALEAAGRRPTVNVKVFYEGEEEQGSPHLAEILGRNRDLLRGDVFVLSDGPRHQSGRMQVFFGARGTSDLELTVYGPARPLHSGHYGNWAPNPAVMLTHLIDSLRDEDGRILIPGYYDDVRPLTPAESSALAALPDVETGLKEELALGRTEGTERLASSIARPAINVRGIRFGDVTDAAANAISTEARASFDFRLVPDQTPRRVRERTEAFLREKGWELVGQDPDAATLRAHPRVAKLLWRLGYPGYRADMNAPAARAVVASIERATGAEVLRMPMLGGSVPMSTFADALGVPIIGVPLANYDNNQHAANENLRLQNLWDGIDIYGGLLTDVSW